MILKVTVSYSFCCRCRFIFMLFLVSIKLLWQILCFIGNDLYLEIGISGEFCNGNIYVVLFYTLQDLFLTVKWNVSFEKRIQVLWANFSLLIQGGAGKGLRGGGGGYLFIHFIQCKNSVKKCFKKTTKPIKK